MSAGRLLGGRYQVGELLGYGGMAEVHRGRDLRLGRDVAIKMLRTDLARDATFQERFRREAQNAASLNHPAIVAIYDTGEEHAQTGETIPFIVMEFVNGRTLKEVLGAEGRLMPRRALEITADICAALEFSHRHGIIHRDIKPGNVMLTQTGQVKVMDFGIARALASGATTMTQTSAVIGTAQYLSPEQARGEPVDARSDVYATGCVLFELLTGHPPFVGDNPVSVAYQHVREDPRAPSEANRDVTPDIDAVVLKALAKNRMNRYQSGAEMRSDLLRAANGRPVLATPVMRDMETAPLVPPPPRIVGNRNTGTMARVGPPQRRGSTWLLVALGVLALVAVTALGIGLYLNNKPQRITVPNLQGLTQAQAEQALQSNKLNGNSSPLNDPQCDKDKVVNQTPSAGTQVDQGTSVSYQVCAGPGTVTIPTVVGKDKATAQSQLQGLGLVVQINEVNSDQPKDQVLKIDPGEGQAVAKGSTVTLSVSLHNQIKVPPVTGLTKNAAINKLHAAGFTNIDPVDQLAAADQVGLVTGQQPDAGTLKMSTDQITIFIGRANEPSSPASSPSTSPSPGTGG